MLQSIEVVECETPLHDGNGDYNKFGILSGLLEIFIAIQWQVQMLYSTCCPLPSCAPLHMTRINILYLKSNLR